MVELGSFMSCIFHYNKKLKCRGKGYLLKVQRNWQTFSQAHQEYREEQATHVWTEKGDIITDTSYIKNDSEASETSVPVHVIAWIKCTDVLKIQTFLYFLKYKAFRMKKTGHFLNLPRVSYKTQQLTCTWWWKTDHFSSNIRNKAGVFVHHHIRGPSLQWGPKKKMK